MSPAAIAVGLAAVVALAAAAAWFVTAPAGVSRGGRGGGRPSRATRAAGRPSSSSPAASPATCRRARTIRFGSAAGMELKTPFGSFFPPNISPDPNDGIGGWTAVDFANALLAGVSPTGRAFLSGLPLSVLSPHVGQGRARSLRLPAHDAAGRGACAVRTRSTFPSRSAARSASGSSSTCRRSISPAAAARPDLRALGRYLVEGPGPLRRMPFAARLVRRNHRLPPPDRRAAAGRQGQGAEHHRRRASKTGPKSDIADALSTGFTPSGDVLGGAMAAVVRNLAQVPEPDLAAIAHYLKTYRPARRR